MLPRCCFVWSVLKEFWLCPFPCFPAELSHLFFPGSSCHLHQKVNLFLFPISAFITWKWLLWKILIKHRLFPGWTETALQLLNCLTSCFVCSYRRVCVGGGGHMAGAGSGFWFFSPSSAPSSTSGVGVWLIPCCSGFSPAQSPHLALAVPAESWRVAMKREGGTCV